MKESKTMQDNFSKILTVMLLNLKERMRVAAKNLLELLKPAF
jgi:hypothetical protein